jgi:hypothetical protein
LQLVEKIGCPPSATTAETLLLSSQASSPHANGSKSIRSNISAQRFLNSPKIRNQIRQICFQGCSNFLISTIYGASPNGYYCCSNYPNIELSYRGYVLLSAKLTIDILCVGHALSSSFTRTSFIVFVKC